jgi:hypothetical protein
MRRVLCMVIVAICSSAWAYAQNPTIADIARQERARRQAKAKGVVINNKTLGIPQEVADKRAAEPQPPEPPAPAIPAAVPGAGTESQQVQDEKSWRNRFEDVRMEVRRAENEAAVAQLDLNSANLDVLTRAFDPNGRGPAAVTAATKRLDEANKNVIAARAKLSLLEEELRRSGAPAGWAR